MQGFKIPMRARLAAHQAVVALTLGLFPILCKVGLRWGWLVGLSILLAMLGDMFCNIMRVAGVARKSARNHWNFLGVRLGSQVAGLESMWTLTALASLMGATMASGYLVDSLDLRSGKTGQLFVGLLLGLASFTASAIHSHRFLREYRMARVITT